jgi:hypothetical protein
MLTELTSRIGGLPALLGLMEEYQRRLSPAMLRTVGGDRFPRRQMHAVQA